MRALALCSLLLGCEVTPPRRPNILLITLDTTRVDALSPYGNPVSLTPNLLWLAQEGVRFDRAYSVTPLTIPAHSSIFTGQYPVRHGVRDNGDFFLGPEAHTLAERLKEAGYATMASVGAEVTSHHWGFAQGFDAYFDDMSAGSADESNRWRIERPATAVIDDALSFWSAPPAPAAPPWFAWIHVFDAHHPYTAPPAHARLLPDDPYLAELSYIDQELGRLFNHLRSRNELDNTLIIAVADHGEGFGSHGEALHGVLIYDATTHIPMIIRPPGGLPAPRTVSAVTSQVDLAPTLLAAAGLPPDTFDGIDLSGTFAPEPAPLPAREVVVESLYAWHHYGWSPLRAAVTDEQKVIDATTPELYLRADRLERENLAPQRPAEVEAARASLRARYASSGNTTAQAAALSPDRIAQLEALGYMTGGAPTTGQGFDEGLPDPVSHLPALRQMEAARGALQAGALPEAEAALRALIAAEPGLNEARSLLVSVLGRAGRHEEARAELLAIDALRPSANTKNALGAQSLARGDLTDAQQRFAEALEIDPFLATAWSGRLQTLFLLGETARLRSALIEATGRIPGLPAADVIEAVLLGLRGESTRSAALLSGVAQRAGPYQPFYHLGLGLVAALQGEADRAEDLFTEELRLYPPAVPARKELVKLYAGQLRYADQLAQLDVLVHLQPRDTLNIHARAQALFNLQRYDEAGQALTRCLSLEPQSPGCLLLLANVYKKQGKEAEAMATFEEAKAAAAQAKGQERR